MVRENTIIFIVDAVSTGTGVTEGADVINGACTFDDRRRAPLIVVRDF